MEQDGTWGDHLILFAAANYCKRNICVISSLPHANDIIIEPDHPVENSKPLVVGHVHDLHFVSLQTKQGIVKYINTVKGLNPGVTVDRL